MLQLRDRRPNKALELTPLCGVQDPAFLRCGIRASPSVRGVGEDRMAAADAQSVGQLNTTVVDMIL